MKMKPQTTYITVDRRVVVTIMTLATAGQLNAISGYNTGHPVGIREMKACSKPDTDQDNDDHKNPRISHFPSRP